MVFSPSTFLFAAGVCFSTLAEVVGAAQLERRACAGNNLIRALKDARYSSYASPWCSSYISIPVVTSTVTGGTSTATSFAPNENTITVTETDTSFATQATTVVASSVVPGASTHTATVISWYNPGQVYTRTVYTTTTTTTITLSKATALARRTVSVPDNLESILSKYSPSSLTSACSCLSVPPSTTVVSVPATTTTQVIQSAAPTTTATTNVAATISAVVTSTVLVSSVDYTFTRVVTGEPIVTSSTTVSTGYTVTSTVCAYTNSPVANPSFDNGLTSWELSYGGITPQATISLDNTTSHNANSSSVRLSFNQVGTFLGVRQTIVDLCPTTSYNLSMWIYTDNYTPCYPYIALGGGYSLLKDVSIQPGAWRQVNTTIRTNGQNQLAQYFVWCDTYLTASFNIDDLSVVKAYP